MASRQGRRGVFLSTKHKPRSVGSAPGVHNDSDWTQMASYHCARVWKRIREHPELHSLSITDRAVLNVMALHASPTGLEARLAQGTIAAYVGCTDRGVRKSLDRLEAALTVKYLGKGMRGVLRYRLLILTDQWATSEERSTVSGTVSDAGHSQTQSRRTRRNSVPTSGPCLTVSERGHSHRATRRNSVPTSTPELSSDNQESLRDSRGHDARRRSARRAGDELAVARDTLTAVRAHLGLGRARALDWIAAKLDGRSVSNPDAYIRACLRREAVGNRPERHGERRTHRGEGYGQHRPAESATDAF